MFVLAGGSFNQGWYRKEDYYAGKKDIKLMLVRWQVTFHLHNTKNEVKLKNST